MISTEKYNYKVLYEQLGLLRKVGSLKTHKDYDDLIIALKKDMTNPVLLHDLHNWNRIFNLFDFDIDNQPMMLLEQLIHKTENPLLRDVKELRKENKTLDKTDFWVNFKTECVTNKKTVLNTIKTGKIHPPNVDAYSVVAVFNPQFNFKKATKKSINLEAIRLINSFN